MVERVKNDRGIRKVESFQDCTPNLAPMIDPDHRNSPAPDSSDSAPFCLPLLIVDVAGRTVYPTFEANVIIHTLDTCYREPQFPSIPIAVQRSLAKYRLLTIISVHDHDIL